MHSIWFEGVTAFGQDTDALLVATGNSLQRVALRGMWKAEEIELPLVLSNAITAVASDNSNWWLGTFGGGLVRIGKSSRTASIYGEKDGFLMRPLQRWHMLATDCGSGLV